MNINISTHIPNLCAIIALASALLTTGCFHSRHTRNTPTRAYPFAHQNPPSHTTLPQKSPTPRPRAQQLPSSQHPLPLPGAIFPFRPLRLLVAPKTLRQASPVPLFHYASDPKLLKLRFRIVNISQKYVSKPPPLVFRGQRFRYDCSGLVAFVYAHLGVQLLVHQKHLNGVGIIAQLAHRTKSFYKRKIPQIGDLIFWDRTYDVNRNGSLVDDRWTHIGIVESISADGTIVFIHNEKTRITRGKMNLFSPQKTHNRHGKRINTTLRRCTDPQDQCTTSLLWSGFAKILQRPLPPHLDESLNDPMLSRLPHTAPATKSKM